MNKSFTIGLGALLVAGFGAATAGGMGGGMKGGDADENARFTFDADLSLEQVPGAIGPSDATGDVSVSFANDLSSVDYTLNVTTGDPVTVAHFHCAPAGVNAPPVAVIQLGASHLTNADIIPSIDDPRCGVTVNNVASLLNAMLQGRIYANIHSTGGVSILRGQIFPPLPEARD